jgi:hypothetical protein
MALPRVEVRGKILSRWRTEAEGALAIRCDFLDRFRSFSPGSVRSLYEVGYSFPDSFPAIFHAFHPPANRVTTQTIGGQFLHLLGIGR